MHEFELIKKYFSKISKKNKSALNLNDDVFFDKKKGIAISVDTYNLGYHFIDFKYPDLVIKKILRSSISDLVCKGVLPKCYFIAGSGNIKTFSKKNELLKFYKPKNIICSKKKQDERKIIYEVINKKYQNFIFVGRLDFNSEGLILLTNSSDISRNLELPKNKFERVYTVKIRGHLTNSNLTDIERGVSLEGLNYKPIVARVLESKKSYSWIEMVLTEGKNREIRKILASFNLTVVRLIRNSFGPFKLDNLQTGESKKIKLEDFTVLKNFWTEID